MKFYLLEQLFKNANQQLGVGRAENFCHKIAATAQTLGGQAQSGQGQAVLCKGIMGPVGADVWGAVVQNTVRLPLVQLFAHRMTCLKEKIGYWLFFN